MSTGFPIAVTPDIFDRHHHLLNAGNGVIDLRTGQLQPHDPGLFITKITDLNYRPDARHPDVDTVLQVVTDPVRGWLQAMFGYAATGYVSEDILPVLDGTGSNGKSALLGAVAAALDEYACPAPPKLLMKGSHDEHPTLIADLHGRRLVTIEETAEGGSLAVERMKALTGGSTLKARFMRRDYFEFEATHQLVIATNHRPAVNSTDHATWRRLRLIPFPYRYTTPDEARPGDRTIDRGLRERLRTGRAQKEAMLAWIVAGAVQWSNDGLPICPEITNATDEWRKAEDVIYRFVTERCETSPGCSVRSSELHRSYKEWCESEGRPAGSNKEFSKRLSDHDLTTQHSIELRSTNAANVWFGIDVKEWM